MNYRLYQTGTSQTSPAAKLVVRHAQDQNQSLALL